MGTGVMAVVYRVTSMSRGELFHRLFLGNGRTEISAVQNYYFHDPVD